ncbi:SAM-dependent methyltransferase, partial [bacterium]|nr:SAM-dependent methyltransferase [bacterium]
IAERVPHLLPRVVWLDRLPECFDGLVLANELLDALPVHLVVWREGESGVNIVEERGVGIASDGQFVWIDRPANGFLLQRALA